jgi:hypothetical protein
LVLASLPAHLDAATLVETPVFLNQAAESYPQPDNSSHKASQSSYIQGMTNQSSTADTFDPVPPGDTAAGGSGAVRSAAEADRQPGMPTDRPRVDPLVDAAADVARWGASSADYDALSDADALAGQKSLARLQREIDTHKAWMAKTLAQRSRWELGQSGLAKQQGHLSPESLIQELTGGTKAETRRLVDVGRMLAETEEADARAAEVEAARRSAEELDPATTDAAEAGVPPLPSATVPWHAPLSRAVNAGTVSIDAAHAIRTGLGDIDSVVTGPLLAEALDRLLLDAASLNVDQLLKAARRTRDDLDADGIREREQKAWDDRYLRIWTLDTGQVRIDGLFPPEQGQFIKATFDSFTSPRRGGVRFVDTERAAWARRVQDDPRTTAQITCDGFIDLLEAGTTVNPDEMLGGRRPAVQILTTATPTAQRTDVEGIRDIGDILIAPPGRGGHGYLEGTSAPVSAATIERLICNSGSVEIRFDELNRPLDLGREQRLFTRAQRRALAARDGGCAWPGCDRPPAFTEAHHIEHWARDNGSTNIDQGILLCHAHHMLLHNQRWQIFENSGRFWLRPPAMVDPGQTLIEMPGRNRPRPA